MTEHTPLPPFAATSGPRSARIVFVAEAWGESEESLRGKPLVGASGKEFWLMLGQAWPEVAPALHAEISEQHKYGLAWHKVREAWMAEAEILFTNVFAFRPSSTNKIDAICCSKKELPKSYDLPHLEQGKYVRPEYLGEINRLYEEIAEVGPNLIVALGNVACWAILQATNIGSIRGAVTQGAGRFGGLKVLPTYHPAGVLRNWAWRPIVLTDLMKARREAAFPEIRRPRRQILINPTLAEIRLWRDQVMYDFRRGKAGLLAVDTETEIKQIKTVGFAGTPDWAIAIPIWHPEKGSYWTLDEEIEVWSIVAEVLESGIPLLFQNGLYDIQYFISLDIWPKNPKEDSMLLHHSIFPEMLKGLGFQGSVYTNEASWKLMRKRKKEAEKRDE